MIQSKLISAFGQTRPEITDRISAVLSIEPDHEPDSGTTIQAMCCECGQTSWYRFDTSPVDVRDLIGHASCCDDETTFVQAFKDMTGSYIADGDIGPLSATMISDLEMWRGSQS